MKIVIAMDAFKECLTSMQAGMAVHEGILRAIPDAETIIRPLADGGEGTVEALTSGLSGEQVSARVTGPMGEMVDCCYGILPNGVAAMEAASSCGLSLVPEEQRDPRLMTTFGLGELILDALERGCRSFIIGIGGSATNDGGIGMLTSLGFRFLTAAGESAGIDGRAAAKVETIDAAGADARLAECRFRIACDVNNPLCGPNGAAQVYGPQKGATPEIAGELDAGLAHFSAVVRRYFSKEFAQLPGAGAAGGLGFAFASFLSATLEPGIAIVLDATRLADALAGADFFITGEGRMDAQSAMGKAASGAARLAKRFGAVTLAFAGATTGGATAVNQNGIDAYFAIPQTPLTLAEAMEPERAKANLAACAEQVFRMAAALRA